jgi:uncharacterized protein (DUF2147 family)
MRSPLPIVALAAVAALMLTTAPAQATSPATGLWTLGEGKAEIVIDECGQALCGRIVNAAKIAKNPDVVDKKNKDPDLRLRKLKGLLVLTGFTGGPTEWRGGAVYNPSDGSTYKATLRLVDANTLNVTGCIVRPLCKTTKLTRARPGDAVAG